jgi:hypothetical protein
MQGMGTKWMLTTLLVMQEIIVHVSFICLINIFTNNLILTHVHCHKQKSNRSVVYRSKINHERVVHCAFFLILVSTKANSNMYTLHIILTNKLSTK